MKIVDKVKRKYKSNKIIINFLLITVLIGVVFGSILVLMLNENDKLMIKDYIIDYSNSFNSKIDFFNIFKNSLFSNLIYILLIWILGISIIGIPVSIFICFFKGFIIGFSLSSFIYTFKFKGLILGVLTNLPSILNLLIIVVLSIYSLKFSYVLIRILLKKVTINFKNIIKIYTLILLISIGYIFITSIVETFLPLLLKSLAII